MYFRYSVIPVLLAVTILFSSVSCSPDKIRVPKETTDTAKEKSLVPADSPEEPDRGFYMGILPSPASSQEFEEAHKQAASSVEFVPVWGRPTPFYELASELSGDWGRVFVEGYIRSNGLFPLVHMSFFGQDMALVSPPDLTVPSLINTEWRESFKKAAVEVLIASRPLYFSLGNEVNRWFEKYGAGKENPNGFQHYVSLYEEIYDILKNISPGTIIFCTFAREMVNENHEADLAVLNMFNPDKLDILVLTSYPHSVQGINLPSDIPDDYYLKVLNYLPGKSLGFSEIAWPALDSFGGETSQSEFLGLVSGPLTTEQDIELVFLGWPWLHDLSADDTIGLLRKDGTSRPAYAAWRSLSWLGRYRTRQQAIPAGAVKMAPENDKYPPILHSEEFYQPAPLPSPVNSAGAEDSPFITPDGKTFYVFFTPDVKVPVEKQLLDGVTGVYMSYLLENGSWSEPERVLLNRDISLDGCVYVNGNQMWFCSARRGYSGLHWFTAEYVNSSWQNWKYSNYNLLKGFDVGELHFSSDLSELYYHSSRPGGLGEYDIWVTRNIEGKWQEPENISVINSPDSDGWPFISEDGKELWFTRFYMGSPALFRSELENGKWAEPELMVSQFAGEPTLDSAGNLYFVHHYYDNNEMLEADIYLARRK